MGRSGQSPTKSSKVLGLCLWFIVAGAIEDASCTQTVNDNQTPINQSVSTEHPSDSSGNKNPGPSREGRAVPARTKTLQFDAEDYREFLYDEALGKVRKIPLYLLKLYSYNKNQLDRRQGRPTVLVDSDGNSLNLPEQKDDVIPVVRNGRQKENSLHPFFGDLHEDKRLDKGVIPYPRLGRNHGDGFIYDDEFLDKLGSPLSLKVRRKRETSDYILPQIRYGRSMVLLTKTDKSKGESPPNFVLPYPRPGKRYEAMLPYPRPGRSDAYVENRLAEIFEEKKKQDYMIPSARLGRSGLDDDGVLEVVDGFLGLKVNPLLLKGGRDGGKNNGGESTSTFVIPYPRPGKRSSAKSFVKNHKPKNERTHSLADYVLPYPRPGKRSYQVALKAKNEADSKLERFVLPYPRPGRSADDWLDAEDNDFRNDDFDDETPSFEQASPVDQEYEYDSGTSMEEAGLTSRSKRSNNVVPYPRLGRSNSLVPYPRPGRSDAMVPYPRPGRSSTSIVPYPRPGRSDAVLPYPRLGRSEAVLPYPRLGRSNTIVPYPRQGRSNAIVPYPRPGRSGGGEGFIVPYPRPGRSYGDGKGYVLPHPRIGRAEEDADNETETSNTVIPYPRLGRAENLASPLPETPNGYHKLNKHMIPRVDDSVYLLPYPRPGRSGE